MNGRVKSLEERLAEAEALVAEAQAHLSTARHFLEDARLVHAAVRPEVLRPPQDAPEAPAAGSPQRAVCVCGKVMTMGPNNHWAHPNETKKPLDHLANAIYFPGQFTKCICGNGIVFQSSGHWAHSGRYFLPEHEPKPYWETDRKTVG